jgi:tRNA A37 threonylcarbamoyladenosine synthetase subunit TsaC/SUA5/YrdC
MSSTLILPGEELPLNDPEEIRERLERRVDLVIDGGPCAAEPTTVVDLTGANPQLLRQGKGDASQFL